MKKLTIAAMATAISLALSATAMAKAMPKAEFKNAKKNITTEFRAAKTRCDLLRAKAKGICMAEAEGRKSVALAELAARYQPGRNDRNNVRIAKARAAQAVAREKCSDLAGHANDVCMKEAEAAKPGTKTKIRISKTYKAYREKYAQMRADRHKEIVGAR